MVFLLVVGIQQPLPLCFFYPGLKNNTNKLMYQKIILKQFKDT